MNLVDKIKKYLTDNPHLLTSKYADTAKKFGTNYEQIRAIARRIREGRPMEMSARRILIICRKKKRYIIFKNQNNKL